MNASDERHLDEHGDHRFDEHPFDEQLRRSLPADPPTAVEQRLQARFEAFRAQVASRSSADAVRARRKVSLGWRIGLAAAAAALVLLTIGVTLRPSSGLAEVAANVFKQPWIHVRTVTADNRVVELWYAPQKQIKASVSPSAIQFQDYRTEINYSYEPEQKTLYRLPQFQSFKESQIETMIAVLSEVARQQRPLEEPLADLKFLGKDHERLQVIDQHLQKVMEGGKQWLDYQLTVRYPDLPEPVEMLFRVDAETKLLRLCRMTGRKNGEPATRESQFEYPETGPADIYALGVPQSATLVDRVPAGDLKRIVESLRDGRERMDSYRAVFVNLSEGFDYAWWLTTPRVFYRQGDRFRADSAVPRSTDLVRVPKPADATDLRAWWQERLTAYRLYPQTVIDGRKTYRTSAKEIEDPDGSLHVDVTAVHASENGTEMFPPEYSMLPEFACRPPMGIGGEHAEPIIDLHPSEGPAGCILLRVLDTPQREQNKQQAAGIPSESRYWLDPQRDYIVMRWDMLNRDAEGKETLVECALTEETARSPQGVWYATKIRRKNSGTTADGKPFDQVYHLYVDFDADLPDALFDPPRTGSAD